ncbi:MAG: hypothetical protein WCR46_11730 [Deltaproteobacteria bacterium]
MIKRKNLCAIAMLLFVVVAGMGAGCGAFGNKSIAIVYSDKIDSAIWADPNLQKRFNEYWYNRFAGYTEANFKMESPHFVEMIQFQKYNGYVQNAKKNKLLKIKIFDVEKETDFLVNVYGVLFLQSMGGEVTESSIKDRWVRVDDEWFHLLYDPLFFNL